VAVNLARVLALEGRRVLLVDADLRRPRLKELLADESVPGLEEYLWGEAPLAATFQATPFEGVSVLGARHSMESPAEAPGSPRFRALWLAVRAEFDFVVVDTSPIHAASEVPVVAGSADASLLVVEEGRTGARQASAAKRRLENHHVRVLGLVVNRSQVRLSRTSEVARNGKGPGRVAAGWRRLVGTEV